MMIVRRTSDRASRADTNEHCYSVRTVYLYVNNFVILERLYIYIYIYRSSDILYSSYDSILLL